MVEEWFRKEIFPTSVLTSLGFTDLDMANKAQVADNNTIDPKGGDIIEDILTKELNTNVKERFINARQVK
jgi:hypothetical protein